MSILPEKMDKVYPHIVQPESLEGNPFRSNPNLCIRHRKPTDVCFLTVFATFFAVLFCFIGYCMYFGDINRITKGYDHCGTVCDKTPKDTSTNESLVKCYNERKKSENFGPYHTSTVVGGIIKRVCTDNCTRYDKYETLFNRCIPDKNAASAITKAKYILVEVCEDFQLYWEQLVYMCLLSLFLSFAVLLLFRYCVGCIVWIILIAGELACIGGAIATWTLWIRKKQTQDKYQKDENLWIYFGCAVGATVLSIVVGLVIFFMRKKIDLVIQLFTEAGKAIGSMPGLLLQPILSFLAFAATISSGIYFCLWIASAGHITQKGPDNFYYEKNGWIKATAFLNIIGILWMIQFITACQHLIVAGAVSKWYFTREKSYLSSPLTESAYNLTRFHLGSAALGSFLITLIQILKTIVSILRRMLKERQNSCLMCIIKTFLTLCDCCLGCVEWIAHLFSSNAYIIVAMYGYSFFKAGKQAVSRITAHPLSFAAINSVGDFILFLAKLLVVVVTEATAVNLIQDKGIHHLWVFLVLIGLFSLSIAHCFITVYEMTIDTIFICFCEDSEMNDGLSKPYYMSRGLMEYVDNSKKALEMHDKKRLYGKGQSNTREIQSVTQSLEKKEKQ